MVVVRIFLSDGVFINFMYLLRFSISSVIKLVFDDDDIVDDTSYRQTNITSSFTTVLFSSFVSSFMYSS